MTIGFVLCYMEGSLAYRVFPCEGTTCGAPTRKWIHGILQAVATACGIAGTVCIFKFHNATDGLTLYSLHSWIGLITVVLFTFQFVMGLWFFGKLWLHEASHHRRPKLPRCECSNCNASTELQWAGLHVDSHPEEWRAQGIFHCFPSLARHTAWCVHCDICCDGYTG